MDTILRTIRNADSINAPAQGATASSLSITVEDPQNPTLFRVSNGTLEIREGLGNYIPLTNAQVRIDDFTVENLSASDTSEIVRIMFTIRYQSDSTHAEYIYSRRFESSASIRIR
jgi:hypothetical protein